MKTNQNTSAVGLSAALYCMIAVSGHADCALDTNFRAVGFGTNATVYAIAPHTDGKVIVGGVLNYQNGYYSRSYLARFTSTGALDTSFNPAPNGTVYAILVEPDGKIIISGAFTTVAGMSRYHIARLNSDGSVDYTGFNPAQPNHYIVALARQDDGKILIGGAFTTLGGVSHNAVARLNTDGSRDGGFSPSISGGATIVYSIAVYPSGTPSAGKILVGGDFATAGLLARTNLARLATNGLVDSSFVTKAANGDALWLNGTVYSVATAYGPFTNDPPETVERVLIGGAFTTFGDNERSYFARLLESGVVDDKVKTHSNPTAVVKSIKVDSDHAAYLGGSFAYVQSHSRNGTVRLVPAFASNLGNYLETDTSWGCSPNGVSGGVVETIALSGSELFVGGSFTNFEAAADNRNKVAKLVP